jgi:hypothetical protein
MLSSILLAALASAAPATVLDHRVETTISSGRSVTTKVTWIVRIDDPAACAAGLLGPPGLDGARNGGATILEDAVVLPDSVAVGDTFTFSHTATGAFDSGVVLSAPGLPSEHVYVSINAPSNLPLTVWADPGGHPTWSSKSGRSVTLVWDAVPEGGYAQVVWSTLPDWFDAGKRMDARITSLLAEKDALGRALASDASSLTVAEAARRVFESVAVPPGQPGRWEDAKPAVDVLHAASGTGADRAVVLLSLLRVAGYDARPAQFRPVGARGAFPVTVPAPAIVPLPAIVVYRKDKEPVWIDPSAPFAPGGGTPANLVGGWVWEAGDLPRPLADQAGAEGRLALTTQITVGADGGQSWTTAISAEGAAIELVRTLLRPLDEPSQRAAIERLVKQARPDASQVTVTIGGVERTDRPLTITVIGREGTAGKAFAGGVATPILPVLAPALAAWLPPDVVVRETVGIVVPPTLRIAGFSASPALARPEALISRRVKNEGERVISEIEIERPYRVVEPSREAVAARFLAEEGRKGLDLLLLTPDAAEVQRSLTAGVEPLDPAEALWFRAFSWWEADKPKKATRLIGTPDQPLDALIPALVHWGRPKDTRPWEALLAERGTTEADQLAIARGMADAGLVWQADQAARRLGDTATDPKVRAEAILLALDVQVEGVEGWKDPNQWMTEAAGLGVGDDPRFALGKARIALTEQRWSDAAALVRPLAGSDPEVDVVLAQADASAGTAAQTVIDAAIRAADARPGDPAVVAGAAEALAMVGRYDLATEYGRAAAQLAATDPARWSRAVDFALADGDLGTATWAARRASDLDPQDTPRAERLLLLARLRMDRALEDTAWERLGGRANAGQTEGVLAAQAPSTLDELLAITPEEALLALLSWHDAEVVADPVKLAIRAQLRLDHGQLDQAARDGLLLATRHKRMDGVALAFAATAGRVYSTSQVAQLDRAATADATARGFRLEYRLISGNGDALADAKALGDDRGKAVLGAKTAQPTGWPTDLAPQKAPPPAGFKVNPALSVPGVLAWADPDDAISVLRIGGAPTVLPPPLSGLYTVAPRPVADLPNGGRLVRLVGGFLPAYAAIAQYEGLQVVGLGFSPESATRALERGRP